MISILNEFLKQNIHIQLKSGHWHLQIISLQNQWMQYSHYLQLLIILRLPVVL